MGAFFLVGLVLPGSKRDGLVDPGGLSVGIPAAQSCAALTPVTQGRVWGGLMGILGQNCF